MIFYPNGFSMTLLCKFQVKIVFLCSVLIAVKIQILISCRFLCSLTLSCADQSHSESIWRPGQAIFAPDIVWKLKKWQWPFFCLFNTLGVYKVLAVMTFFIFLLIIHIGNAFGGRLNKIKAWILAPPPQDGTRGNLLPCSHLVTALVPMFSSTEQP